MKRLKQHWLAGPLSWLLSAALALPAVLWLLSAPQAARAQSLNRLPTWAVTNFTNHSGYGAAEIGIQASDGFVVELGKSNRYNVLPRAQTQQTIADLGLTPPLDTIGLQKLARSLDADAAVTGEVAAVSFANNPRRATAYVIVRVVDRQSGELVNGAIAQGTSTPRPIPTNDDDSLVNQAIANADFDAVKQISQFSLPRATVLIHRDLDTVTLNKGTQDGLFNGLKMQVTRNGQQVGRIQIANAGPDESDATVTDRGLGIQSQDVATAIYQLPAYSYGPGNTFHLGGGYRDLPNNSSPSGGNSRPGYLNGPLGVILALGVGLGIYSLARGSNSSSGTTSIGGGRTGGVNAFLTATGLGNFTPGPQTNAANNPDFVPLAIGINFNQGDIGGSGQVREFHVYRNPQPANLQNLPFTGTTVPNITLLGRIPIFSPASSPSFDSAADVGPLAVSKPSPTDQTALIGPVIIADQATVGTTVTNVPVVGTGLNVGDRVSYSVEALYAVPNFQAGQTAPGGAPVGIGTGTGNQFFTLSVSVTTNTVTYLQPVLVRTNNSNTSGSYPDTVNSTAALAADNDVFSTSTGPTNVILTLHSVFAAGDSGGSAVPLQYRLQFSPDASFNSGVFQVDQTGPSNANSVNFRRGPTFQFGPIDLTKNFSNPGTLFVRVGVRDLRNGSDDGSNPFLFSTVDPVSAKVVPAALTPGNAAAPSALARGGVVSSRLVRLAPGRSGYGSEHTRTAPETARPSFTLSATPHIVPGDPSAHPGVGSSGYGIVRPTLPGAHH